MGRHVPVGAEKLSTDADAIDVLENQIYFLEDCIKHLQSIDTAAAILYFDGNVFDSNEAALGSSISALLRDMKANSEALKRIYSDVYGPWADSVKEKSDGPQ